MSSRLSIRTLSPAGAKIEGNVASVGTSTSVGATSFGASGSIGNWSSQTGIAEGLGVKGSVGLTMKEDNTSIKASSSGNASVGVKTGLLDISVAFNPISLGVSIAETIISAFVAKAEEVKMQMKPQEYIVPQR
jgi:hypothetical protein